MLHLVPFYGSLMGRYLGVNSKGEERRALTSHVLVYGALEAHSRGPKGCIASNKTLGEDVGLSVSRVASILSELSMGGWIQVELDENNQRLSIHPLMELTGGNPPLPQTVRPLAVRGNIDNSLDNSTSTNVEGASTVKGSFGNSQVNEVMDTWTAVMGWEIAGNVKKNRIAVTNLIKRYGVDGLKRLIPLIAQAHSTPYAPRIEDFVSLQANLNKFVLWVKQREAMPKPESFPQDKVMTREDYEAYGIPLP